MMILLVGYRTSRISPCGFAGETATTTILQGGLGIRLWPIGRDGKTRMGSGYFEFIHHMNCDPNINLFIGG